MGRTYKDRRAVEFGRKGGRKHAAQHKEDKKYRNQKNNFRNVLDEMLYDQDMAEIEVMDTSISYSDYDEYDNYIEDYPY